MSTSLIVCKDVEIQISVLDVLKCNPNTFRLYQMYFFIPSLVLSIFTQKTSIIGFTSLKMR